MEPGSLKELVLTRSVTKHIRKQNKDFLMGTGIGHDFARCNEIITTEATGSVPKTAWVKAFNNFYVSGGEPIMARIVMLLPADIREGRIKEYMKDFNALAEAEGVQLAGGHSEVCPDFVNPQFVVNVTGRANAYLHRRKLVKSGADIIMTGYAAMLGTDILLEKKQAVLAARFSHSYLSEAVPWKGHYSIREAAGLLSLSEDVYYMHDVSSGGVYAALWQLGAYLSKGISIAHYSISILQRTIEFCEVFSINPYMLEGTGAMLAVAKAGSGEGLVDSLMKRGINAAVIGNIEPYNERMVYLGEYGDVTSVNKQEAGDAAFFAGNDNKYIERRCLSPVTGDEINKIK